MDLSQYDSTQAANIGSMMHVRNPVSEMPEYFGDNKPVTITVLGSDSDQMHTAMLSMGRKMARKRTIDPEDLEESSIHAMASCITGWTGIFNGAEAVECNIENAYNMLKKYKWLRDQIREFQDDRTNFLA